MKRNTARRGRGQSRNSRGGQTQGPVSKTQSPAQESSVSVTEPKPAKTGPLIEDPETVNDLDSSHDSDVMIIPDESWNKESTTSAHEAEDDAPYVSSKGQNKTPGETGPDVVVISSGEDEATSLNASFASSVSIETEETEGSGITQYFLTEERTLRADVITRTGQLLEVETLCYRVRVHQVGRRHSPTRPMIEIQPPLVGGPPIPTPTVEETRDSTDSILDLHVDSEMDDLFEELSSVVDDITETTRSGEDIRPEAARSGEDIRPEAARSGEDIRPEAALSGKDSRPETTRSGEDIRSEAARANENIHPEAKTESRGNGTSPSDEPSLRAVTAALRTPNPQKHRPELTSGQFGISPSQPWNRRQEATHRPRRETQPPTTYRPAGYNPTEPHTHRAQPYARPPTPEDAGAASSVSRAHPSRVQGGAGNPRIQPVANQDVTFDSFNQSTWPPGLQAAAEIFRRQARMGINIAKHTYIHTEKRIRYRVSVKRSGEIHVTRLGPQRPRRQTRR